MALPVSPIPVQTPVLEGEKSLFTLTWSRWLKSVSDFCVDASRAQAQGGAFVVVSGALATVQYQGVGGVSIPLTSAPKVVPAFDHYNGSTWAKIFAVLQTDGSYSIPVPASASAYVAGTYIVDTTEKR
jgi:hypothetical protein